MGGSGVQRPLKFLKYLAQFGWEPIVLCPEHGAYLYMDNSLNEDLDAMNLKVVRVPNETPLNSKLASFLSKTTELVKKPLRSISDWIYIPDNKKRWTLKATEIGEKLIFEDKIDLIFSSGPPFSSHLAAIELGKRTKTKVVIDYRDAWTNSHLERYPTRWHKKQNILLENRVAENADAICAINEPILHSVTKNGRLNQLRKVISHGYDHADFERALKLPLDQKLLDANNIYFIHNGLFYNERRPDELLEAFATLKRSGTAPKLKLVLQGGLDGIQKKIIEKWGLQQDVIDLGYQPHHQSLRNVMACQATVLLIGHKKRADQIVTGKLYEYIGAKKPIIALVPSGEAKNLLVNYGASYFGNPYDIEQIANCISACYKQISSKNVSNINNQLVNQLRREDQTEKLAMLFNETILL
jgi:glycosyltransferase involved in cell wall biosynthesis